MTNTYMVLAAALTFGCASTVPHRTNLERPTSGTGLNSTLRLEIPFSELPAPGLCRTWSSSTGQRATVDRACDVLMNMVEEGAVVVYRPADAREIHVRYMDNAERGKVYRVDIFDLDTRRLIREIN